MGACKRERCSRGRLYQVHFLSIYNKDGFITVTEESEAESMDFSKNILRAILTSIRSDDIDSSYPHLKRFAEIQLTSSSEDTSRLSRDDLVESLQDLSVEELEKTINDFKAFTEGSKKNSNGDKNKQKLKKQPSEKIETKIKPAKRNEDQCVQTRKMLKGNDTPKNDRKNKEEETKVVLRRRANTDLPDHSAKFENLPSEVEFVDQNGKPLNQQMKLNIRDSEEGSGDESVEKKKK